MMVYDGDAHFLGGQNNGSRPHLLSAGVYAKGINVSNRSGAIEPREGWVHVPFTFKDSSEDQESFTKGKFQGAVVYGTRIIAAVAGSLYAIETNGDVLRLTDEILDRNADEIYLVEAHDQVLASDSVNPVVRVQELTAEVIPPSKDTIKPGRWMAYGQGRLFVVSQDRSLIYASNAFTPLLADSDQLTTFTESPPGFAPYGIGDITGIRFLPILDNGTGMGPLIVTGTKGIYAFDVVTPREQWDQLQIGRSIVGGVHVAGHRALLDINGDLYFRRLEGIGSLISARTDWTSPVNRPVSHEAQGWLDDDHPAQLWAASTSYVRNRLRMTIGPEQSANGEVLHRGVLVMDFQPDSGLTRGQVVFPGIETGTKVLQLVGEYLLGRHEEGTNLALFKLTKRAADKSPVTAEPIKLTMRIETRAYAFDAPGTTKILKGKGYIDLTNILDQEIEMEVDFRPDHYPGWLQWARKTIVISEGCPEGSGAAYYRLPLGTPIDEGKHNPLTKRQVTTFSHLQLRITLKGRATIERLVLSADAREMEDHMDSGFGDLKAAAPVILCAPDDFDYHIT